MREYVVGDFKNQTNAENAVKMLAEIGIKSSFIQVRRGYEVVIVGFDKFHMATALIGSMDIE